MYHFSKKPFTFLWLLVLGVLIALSACTSGETAPDSTPSPPTKVQITPVQEQLVVIVDIANLRSGPGVEFESVATLEQGTLIETKGVS
jgi:uncharacterized protein YgiM (DUF1202 family)